MTMSQQNLKIHRIDTISESIKQKRSFKQENDNSIVPFFVLPSACRLTRTSQNKLIVLKRANQKQAEEEEAPNQMTN
jgi:hypothetical protein